jgi:hypothetical protein
MNEVVCRFFLNGDELNGNGVFCGDLFFFGPAVASVGGNNDQEQ